MHVIIFIRLQDLEEQYRKEKEEADLLFEQQRKVCLYMCNNFLPVCPSNFVIICQTGFLSAVKIVNAYGCKVKSFYYSNYDYGKVNNS